MARKKGTIIMNNELMVFLFGCEVGALGFYFLMLFIEYLGEKRYLKQKEKLINKNSDKSQV
jgi:hypothetical protein|tara:strand:- start:591 stop:773 length:183 start_codon:yes stop_codon:yes gene_type:complete